MFLKNKSQANSRSIQENGFTLLETLIFTTLISVFFVVAAGVSAFSLNVMKTNENKLYATHFAEETLDWIKNEKDSNDWVTFTSGETSRASEAGKTWCLNTSPLSIWPASSGACSGADFYTLSNRFNREALLITDASNNVVSATVTVSWKSVGGATQSVVLKTIFSQFD